MSYPEFTELILEAVKALLPEDVNAEIFKTEKLNQCTKYGIIFKKKDLNYAPIIYMDPFLEAFHSGYTVEALAEEVYRCYIEEGCPIQDEVRDFLSFETAKDKIFVKLVNFDKNKSLLEDIPYRRFLDFAVIPYYEVENEAIFKGCIMIRQEHLKAWNMEEEALLDWAVEHTRICKKMVFRPIKEMIDDYFGADAFRGHAESIYVMTNHEKFLGAVQLSFPGMITQISQKLGGDYFMIPSSVHEWIFLAAEDMSFAGVLWKIVQDVNRKEVQEEEFLSGNLYYYSEKLQKVFIYDNGNKKITGLFE